MICIALCTLAVAPGSFAADEPASAPAASQPADQIVLVRLGDRATVTQEDFENTVKIDPVKGYAIRDEVMMDLVHDRLIWLYAKDHPDLVTPQEVEQRTENHIRLRGFDSLDKAKTFFEAHGLKWSAFERFTLTAMAKAKLVQQGQQLGADESRLKEIFQARRREFDGTYVKARQIFFRLPVYAAPEQRQVARDRLSRMRQDILDGKRTWEQCVAESDSAVLDGDMGRITRHLMANETLAAEAFKLDAGQISQVVDTILGLHLVQVTEVATPEISWDYIRERMKEWMQNEPTALAIAESMRKYPVVGVRPPHRPPPGPTSFPAIPANRPTSTRAAGSRPDRTPVFAGDARRPASRPASAPAVASSRAAQD
ncbi:MAG TPA: peptidylprolyl isomerase [Phycisphaerae bacterium]|nr:peptidylprolyl isomerase [Phycisphaerae bacterium]